MRCCHRAYRVARYRRASPQHSDTDRFEGEAMPRHNARNRVTLAHVTEAARNTARVVTSLVTYCTGFTVLYLINPAIAVAAALIVLGVTVAHSDKRDRDDTAVRAAVARHPAGKQHAPIEYAVHTIEYATHTAHPGTPGGPCDDWCTHPTPTR